MSSSDLISNLFDISQSLSTNILAEDTEANSSHSSSSKGDASASKGLTASRELLNTKRKSRDEDDEITTQEEYIPLIRAPRKRLRAIAPTLTSSPPSSLSHDPLLASIAQGGAVFSVNDTSFHNANKNAKVVSKAQRKKNAKGSNYSDKLKSRISTKQRSKKQLLKSK
jgi:hypothetical protein